MGLATSQARFLCITARKADCEYKSTELAQQKLEITNQLSDISANYANAMNSTKLVWKNDLVENDYGLTYNLLMTPSAANDYNPYMVTTSSGAIVLNSEYAAAAKAAGISKAGGISSADGRDKFIAALVPGGIVTQDTANSIMTTDYVATKMDDGTLKVDKANTSATTGNVGWNSGAGMGSTPLDKNSVDGLDISALITSDLIGKQLVDWAQLITTSSEQITSAKYDSTIKDYDVQIKKAATALQYAEANTDDYKVKEAALNALKDAGYDVISVGKIRDIFDGEGITESNKSKSSVHGMEQTIEIAERDFTGLCFVNLVDFDALWGHRRNVKGYAEELERFDVKLGELLKVLREDDLLIITADHGNDPTYKGTDHTREQVMFVAYSPSMKGSGKLEDQDTFAVIGATIADNFGVQMPEGTIGTSLLAELK